MDYKMWNRVELKQGFSVARPCVTWFSVIILIEVETSHMQKY